MRPKNDSPSNLQKSHSFFPPEIPARRMGRGRELIISDRQIRLTTFEMSEKAGKSTVAQ